MEISRDVLEIQWRDWRLEAAGRRAAVAGIALKARLQLDANERYFRVGALPSGGAPQLGCLGGGKGGGIEAMLAGIPVA